ncbi:hypothetical protein [Shimia ponticola]|uniref:hypothetical protein n=1 Tax=Shimia ponticola TaxID=2582893 RepID=UPI0011BE0317|nr:hypothetical protein [Shimia ponticola]
MACSATAQAVRIEAAELGQGFILKEDGICWALLPRHLLDETGLISVETSPAPSTLGSGEAYADFWDGMDFAVGYVGQAAGAASCTASLDGIEQTSASAGTNLSGTLRFVEPGGALVQYPMHIVETLNHKTFVAEFRNPAQTAFQGMSGAFLFVEDHPIGMAVRTPEGQRQMEFIRIEEIAFATRRWLDGRARTVVAAIDTPDDGLADVGDRRHQLTLVSYNTAPTAAELGPEGLAREDGAYHFDFDEVVRLTFGFEDGEGQGIQRVRIVSEGTGAKPLTVRVMVDPSNDQSSPQQFNRGQMSPDGLFDTGIRSERFARWVTILIESVQGQGPVRIDQIIVE